MDARDYPDAYLLEEALVGYGTRNHVIDKAAKEIKQLRAKVAELEAQLAKYQNLEPVAYVVNAEIRWNTDKIPAFASLYALEMK